MTGRNIFVLIDKFNIIIFLCKPLVVLFKKFKRFFNLLRILLRYVYYKNTLKHCGTNVSIHENVYIFQEKKLSIGTNCSIHPLCYIDAGGGISIGNNVSIAHNVTIMSSNHSWQNNDMPIKYNPVIHKPVVIDDDVWIGAGARIMAGCYIGKRCIIAAGAVVTKDCLPNGLYAGVPAKRIREI